MIKKYFYIKIVMFVWALGVANSVLADMSAKDIMQKNFFATKVNAFTGDVTMVLTNDKGQDRTRRISTKSKLKDNGVDSKVLIRFNWPPDIKKTAFLQIQNSQGDDDIWIYLPALNKSRRLVSNEKKDSFFGTDFSYGDILLPPVNNYSHKLLRSETLDGHDMYVIESIPIDAKIREDIGYSRKISWIDKSSFVERKVEYYDLNGALLKTQTTFDPKLAEPDKQRWVLLRREMLNNQTGHKTIYRFDRFDAVAHLSDNSFAIRALERE